MYAYFAGYPEWTKAQLNYLANRAVEEQGPRRAFWEQCNKLYRVSRSVLVDDEGYVLRESIHVCLVPAPTVLLER